MNAYFVGVVFSSWKFGLIRNKPGVKKVWALGPLRFAFHVISTVPEASDG